MLLVYDLDEINIDQSSIHKLELFNFENNIHNSNVLKKLIHLILHNHEYIFYNLKKKNIATFFVDIILSVSTVVINIHYTNLK
jgi:hypothetical protein